MARRITKRSPRIEAVIALTHLTLGIVLLSLLFSLLALPWVDLSWWRIFRRCVSIAAAITLWWRIKIAEHRSYRSYGLVSYREGKRHLRFGLLLGITTLAVMATVGLATHVCSVAISPDQSKLWRTAAGFLPVAGLVGLLEELVFRGYILRHLLVFSKPLAVIGSSAAYALVDLKSPEFSWMTGMELIGLFLLGVVLALSCLETGQLFLAVGLHASRAYGARVNKVFFVFHDSANWLAGTSRLVNGVASWVALLAIAWIIAKWARGSARGGVQHGKV